MVRLGPIGLLLGERVTADALHLAERPDLVVPDLPDPRGGEPEALGVGLALHRDLRLELRAELPGLDPAGEVDLLRRIQQGDLPDLLQVHPDRIVRGRLERVHLDPDLRHGVRIITRELDDLDALGVEMLRQLREDVLHLVGCDLRERLEDIAGSDEASFAAEHDELFLDLVEALRVSRWLAGRAQRGSSSCVGSTEDSVRNPRRRRP